MSRLLRPALPRALPRPGRPRRPRRGRCPSAFTLHDDARPLGGARPRPRDRGRSASSSPPTRSASTPAASRIGRPLADRRPVGRGARPAPDDGATSCRRPRPRARRRASARRSRRSRTAAPRSTRERRRAAAARRGREAAPDPRRRRARLRPPGLPHLPGVGHRRRGRRRLRARLPLLPESKDEILDTLFLERWDVLLARDRRGRRQARPAEEKLRSRRRASSSTPTRHDPELMQVIIVEVTRAASTFGRTHLAKIREAYDGIADDRPQGAGGRRVPRRHRPGVRRDGLLRGDRAGADGVDLRRPPGRGTERRGSQGTRSSRRSAADCD